SATTVDIGPDATICAGGTVTLDATTAGATYLWSNGATTPTIDATTSGTYSVEVFVGQCSVPDQATITVNPMPVVDLGPDQVFCNGEPGTTLDATWPGANYLWNTGDITPTLGVNTDGTYAVAVSLGNCMATDTVTIAFGSFSYSMGPDLSLCPGDEVTLGADLPAGTATWNGDLIASTYVVNAAGMYTLHLVAPSGCEARDTILVNMVNVGSLDLGPDLSSCQGTSILLDASVPGATYLWEDGSTSPTRMIDQSGTYSVEAFVNACSSTDTITITMNPLPVVDLGPDVAICPGETITFDATTPGATYTWSNGQSGATMTTALPGTSAVVVTVDGCTAHDTVTVGLIDAPVVQLGADTMICEGATLTFNVAQPNTDYLWEDGSTSSIRTVTMPGLYWVDASRNTCTYRDSILVELFSPSQFDLGNDQRICAGANTTIGSPVNGALYTWSNGATTSTITVTDAGTYSVVATVSGCVAEDSIMIDVISVTPPDLGPDRTACEGDPVLLHINAGQVSWSNGTYGPDLVVTEPGLYTVNIDSLGCTASDAVLITFTPMTTSMQLTGDSAICPGTFGHLQVAPIPGAIFTWSDGTTGNMRMVDAPGTYTLHATGACINALDSFTVTIADCDTYIHVPNAFTPNHDGINDTFLPVVDGTLDTYRLDIFDRWGECIHTSTDRTEGWNGQLNGVLVQDGVYVWKLQYRLLGPEGVRSEQLIGHVTLLR
ncbi:MAG: gliding motility-associated C-terminal domain-containing protein, partial [Flavobacteriales bacterium]|nr:gliding motility-associated C-terminal domain-containing protein [Flavobacteriales bacterium]